MKLKTISYDVSLVKYMLLGDKEQRKIAHNKYKTIELFYNSTSLSASLSKLDSLHNIMVLDYIPTLKNNYNFNFATIAQIIKDYTQLIYTNSSGKIDVFAGKVIIEMMAYAKRNGLLYHEIIIKILIPIFRRSPKLLESDNLAYLKEICNYLTIIDKISLTKAKNVKFYNNHWLLAEISTLTPSNQTSSVNQLATLLDSLDDKKIEFNHLEKNYKHLLKKIEIPREWSPSAKVTLLKIIAVMEKRNISPISHKVTELIEFSFNLNQLNTLYQGLLAKTNYSSLLQTIKQL